MLPMPSPSVPIRFHPFRICNVQSQFVLDERIRSDCFEDLMKATLLDK